MEFKSLNEQIRVWRPAGFAGLELRQGTSISQPYPKHWHDEVHFCLIQDGSGNLTYRGEKHWTPAGCLFIVHPGEVHSNQADEGGSCSYRNLYAEPELIRQAAAEITGHPGGLPFFSAAPIHDREVIALYLELHQSLEAENLKLEQDELFLGFLAKLIARHSESSWELREPGRDGEAVYRARDYLMDNFSRNISLDELAGIAGLSPFHLNRVFSREFGLPPHAFLTQVRVARAKSLLKQGASITETAIEVGFSDQSHFTRHFRRLVSVTPGHYLQSKNVQD
ncbi:MAG TPA: AraC family transcriptional regulator [Blastocatellia bacterium]